MNEWNFTKTTNCSDLSTLPLLSTGSWMAFLSLFTCLSHIASRLLDSVIVRTYVSWHSNSTTTAPTIRSLSFLTKTNDTAFFVFSIYWNVRFGLDYWISANSASDRQTKLLDTVIKTHSFAGLVEKGISCSWNIRGKSIKSWWWLVMTFGVRIQIVVHAMNRIIALSLLQPLLANSKRAVLSYFKSGSFSNINKHFTSYL